MHLYHNVGWATENLVEYVRSRDGLGLNLGGRQTESVKYWMLLKKVTTLLKNEFFLF